MIEVVDPHAQADYATVTVHVLPHVHVNYSASTLEVAEGGGTHTFSVTLTADPQRTVVIPLARYHLLGMSSDDYRGVPAYLTFEPGVTEIHLSLIAVDDAEVETEKLLWLLWDSRVDLPYGVSIGTTSELNITITDNDEPVPETMTIWDATLTVGDHYGLLGIHDQIPGRGSAGVLTNAVFQYAGATCTVKVLHTKPSTGEFYLKLDALLPGPDDAYMSLDLEGQQTPERPCGFLKRIHIVGYSCQGTLSCVSVPWR